MLQIEHMTVGDLADVIALEKAVFPNPKPPEVFEHDINVYYVARFDGKLAGYIGIEHVLDEAHIINLAVNPLYRRRGIAAALVQHVLKDAKSFFLEVRKSNTAAIKLYEKIGFQVIDERKNYYADNQEDALVMLYVAVFFSSAAKPEKVLLS
ncbi:MAG: ribosomal protein S18-alanine N-acetyltransferase [Candidatus Margulisiibacteriota bacterium]